MLKNVQNTVSIETLECDSSINKTKMNNYFLFLQNNIKLPHYECIESTPRKNILLQISQSFTNL